MKYISVFHYFNRAPSEIPATMKKSVVQIATDFLQWNVVVEPDFQIYLLLDDAPGGKPAMIC